LSPRGTERTVLYSIKPIPTPTSDTKTALPADDNLGSAPLLGVDEVVGALAEGVLVELEVVLPNARAFAKNASKVLFPVVGALIAPTIPFTQCPN